MPQGTTLSLETPNTLGPLSAMGRASCKKVREELGRAQLVAQSHRLGCLGCRGTLSPTVSPTPAPLWAARSHLLLLLWLPEGPHALAPKVWRGITPTPTHEGARDVWCSPPLGGIFCVSSPGSPQPRYCCCGGSGLGPCPGARAGCSPDNYSSAVYIPRPAAAGRKAAGLRNRAPHPFPTSPSHPHPCV